MHNTQRAMQRATRLLGTQGARQAPGTLPRGTGHAQPLGAPPIPNARRPGTPECSAARFENHPEASLLYFWPAACLCFSAAESLLAAGLTHAHAVSDAPGIVPSSTGLLSGPSRLLLGLVHFIW